SRGPAPRTQGGSLSNRASRMAGTSGVSNRGSPEILSGMLTSSGATCAPMARDLSNGRIVAVSGGSNEAPSSGDQRLGPSSRTAGDSHLAGPGHRPPNAGERFGEVESRVEAVEQGPHRLLVVRVLGWQNERDGRTRMRQ